MHKHFSYIFSSNSSVLSYFLMYTVLMHNSWMYTLFWSWRCRTRCSLGIFRRQNGPGMYAAPRGNILTWLTFTVNLRCNNRYGDAGLLLYPTICYIRGPLYPRKIPDMCLISDIFPFFFRRNVTDEPLLPRGIYVTTCCQAIPSLRRLNICYSEALCHHTFCALYPVYYRGSL